MSYSMNETKTVSGSKKTKAVNTDPIEDYAYNEDDNY